MLPTRSLLDIKKENSPAEFARQLRAGGDVYWWEKGRFWVVTAHGLACSVLRSPDFSCDRKAFFVTRMPDLDLSLVSAFFEVVSKMMVMSDGKAHEKRRGVAALGLTDLTLDRFVPVIEKTVHVLVTRALRKPVFDFVEDIALELPSTVLADLFQIPESERKDFYRWSNNMTQFFGGASRYQSEDGREVNESARSLREYFASLVQERRKHPQDDFLSVLLAHQNRFGLQEDEILSQAIMMLVAGQVTTTDQASNNLYTLLSEPQALSSLRQNPALLRGALEECNRLDPAVTFIFRVAARDTQIGEQRVREGEVVFLSTHAANRDPKVFDQPECWRADRRPNPHLAYGFGPHVCLGAKLARLEMLTCFGHLFECAPRLRFAQRGSERRKHHSLAFSGFESLAVATGE